MTLAGWPGTILPIRVEFQIDGTWTDVTSYVRLANEISINRGQASDQGDPTPSTCSLTLNNRDGLFSNRNPNSAYFGLLPRNLPMRVSVTEDRSFAIMSDADATQIKTADKASIRITGDIDIRAEFDSNNNAQGTLGYYLASRYRRTASANRSWVLFINNNGFPRLNWSTDGSSANLRGMEATEPISMQYGPSAVKVTLDVNNGAGGCTGTFYTSDTINGSWTQLGDPVVSAGTTSIHAGNADLEIGRIDDGVGTGIDAVGGFAGRIYSVQLRDGIGGTLVATAAVYLQARGTTSWVDTAGTPNTWDLYAEAEITPDNRRFTGEISAFPVQWDLTGRDVWVPLEAADVRRRLTKGATALFSALRQFFGAMVAAGDSIGGYWPAEDGTAASQMASASTRGRLGNFIDCQFGAPSDLPATAGSVTLNSTSSRIYLTGNTIANTGYSCFNWAQKMASVPASSVTLVNLFCNGGTIGRINFSVTATTYDLAAYDTSDTLISSNSTGWGTTLPTNWTMFRIQLTQSGGNVQADIGWYEAGDVTQWGAGPLIFAGTAGRVFQATITGNTNNVGTQFAHLLMGQFYMDNIATDYALAVNAFDGETSITRFERICAQIGITPDVRGDPNEYELMGAQVVDTPMNVLNEVARTEASVIVADRNSAGLILRTRRSLINQYGPPISYSADELGPPVPIVTDDDGLLRNSVTATRWDGSTGTAVQDTGPNSTALPTASPPGVGVVPGSITANPYLSGRLTDLAGFDMALGTWDEPRWPSVSVMLERLNYTGTDTKIQQGHNLARLDIGDRFSLTDLPAFLPPDDILLIVRGVQETLGNRTWRITWNTSPYGPYVANDLVTDGTGNGWYRAAAGSCTVTSDFTSSATGAAAFQITTAAGHALWGTTALKPDNFPLNVIVGGEVITVSGISGTTSPQSVTVSARSVNGIVKAHSAGDVVQIQYPFYLGL